MHWSYISLALTHWYIINGKSAATCHNWGGFSPLLSASNRFLLRWGVSWHMFGWVDIEVIVLVFCVFVISIVRFRTLIPCLAAFSISGCRCIPTFAPESPRIMLIHTDTLFFQLYAGLIWRHRFVSVCYLMDVNLRLSCISWPIAILLRNMTWGWKCSSICYTFVIQVFADARPSVSTKLFFQ